MSQQSACRRSLANAEGLWTDLSPERLDLFESESFQSALRIRNLTTGFLFVEPHIVSCDQIRFISFNHPAPRPFSPELLGIGHGLTDLSGHHAKEMVKKRAFGAANEKVNMIALNRALFHFDEKALRIFASQLVDEGMGHWISQTAGKSRNVDFKHDMERIFCRKWPLPAAPALSPQTSTMAKTMIPVRP